MKPRRTVESNAVYCLVGGTEDNDLWVHQSLEEGMPVIASVWEPTREERAAIADGANIELVVWSAQPPVLLRTTNVQLGRGGGTA